MSFVHLHVHSEYSLLQSTGKIEELVLRAKELGYRSLALTDKDAMYGVIPFYKMCKKHDIQPIIGVELAYIAKQETMMREVQDRILLLARNNMGYRSLTKLTTKAHEKTNGAPPYVTFDELAENSEGLIAIVPFQEGMIHRLISKGRAKEAYEHMQWLQAIFEKDQVYIEIQNHWRSWERDRLLQLSHWLKEYHVSLPLVASNHVHFTSKLQHYAHKVIQAIRLGIQLEELPKEFSSEEYYLKSPEEMKELFSAWEAACEETVRVAEKCHMTFEFGEVVLPHYPIEMKEKSAAEYLKDLATRGIYERYELPTEQVWERLHYELDVITSMNFEDYFLIVADFMRFAHEKGILTGPGRGSAAGSLVAYALKITNVDPIKYGLLFERFLNPERVTMPDIDIDFSDDRRDEVIQYVKNKYGKERVAQIITFGTLAAKAAIRDVGRVLGMDTKMIDRISKSIPSRPNTMLKDSIAQSTYLQDLIKKDDQVKQLFQVALEIEGLPRHSSIHAAGIVMSHDPLTNIVPLQEGNDDMYLTQFPMGDLEEIGLLKMDFLGLRNLSFMEKIIDLIYIHRGEKVELDKIPLENEATFQLLSRGETSGIFQLESQGMTNVLRRLRPSHFEDIVAVNALYRPGPMENIPKYIKRKHHEEQINYPHESLREILEPTYGVIIYQEQIMQIASKMAGFSLGEADTLRRAISKKNRDVLEEVRQQFVLGAKRQGFEKEDAMTVYDLIVRFADYGFNRSHSVAYSFISYSLAYLKANYLLEFMCALMNSAMHHHDKLNEYMQEARGLGIKVHPPSIEKSDADCTILEGEIWLGLAIIKNVGLQAVQAVITERERGPFTSIFDLCARTSTKQLPKRSIESLIVAGALDYTHNDRAQMLASVEDAIEYGDKVKDQELGSQTELFVEKVDIPEYMNIPPLSEEEQLNFEKQVLGFYASGHPIESELSAVEKYGRTPISKAIQYKKTKEKTRLACMLENIKVILTKKKEQMAFATLSDETGEIEVTIFPESYQKNRLKLQKGEKVFIEGKWQEYSGRVNFILEQCTTLSILKKKQNKRNGPKLYIKIPYVVEKEKGLEKLKKIIERDPGNIPVILVYEKSGKAILLSDMWNISGDDSILQRMQAIVGKGNVYLKEEKNE